MSSFARLDEFDAVGCAQASLFLSFARFEGKNVFA
jgi:hypothetical protein